jgi:hypothetical protein
MNIPVERDNEASGAEAPPFRFNNIWDGSTRRKKKRLPGGAGAADCAAGYECCYWVGRISCENPMVLTERNDGVRGGKHAGPRVKLVSKV